MRLVVSYLLSTATVGLVDGRLHAVGDAICIEDDQPMHITSGTSRRLRERAVRAEEALLVRIKDRHERHLGEVQSLTKQVDADQDIVSALTQAVHNLDSL